jgi:hypothetical protein
MFRAHDNTVEIGLTSSVVLVVPRSRLPGLEYATVIQAGDIEIIATSGNFVSRDDPNLAIMQNSVILHEHGFH